MNHHFNVKLNDAQLTQISININHRSDLGVDPLGIRSKHDDVGAFIQTYIDL